MLSTWPGTVAELREALNQHDYLIDEDTATIVFLALRLQKPLLVEGPAGSGKTELAKALARALSRRLVRLQCYEGLDEAKALYEWNYQKQLLYLQAVARGASGVGDRGFAPAKESPPASAAMSVYTPDFLLPRPLLEAIASEEPVVLLVDELDKSDAEFESFLLEVLSDFQVSIPELGVVAARHVPVVVLTSNSTRNFGDALRRRCLHLYLDYPDFDLELAIVSRRVKGLGPGLASLAVALSQRLRQESLRKPPGLTETIDWASSVRELGVSTDAEVDTDVLARTLPILVKQHADVGKLERRLSAILEAANLEAARARG